MSGVAIAPRIEGGAGVNIDPAGKITVPGAAPLVTPFQFVGVPESVTTSIVFEDLVSTPVVVAAAGDVLVDFQADANAQYTLAGQTAVLGVEFRALWDAVAEPETARADIEPLVADQLDAIAASVRLRVLVPAVRATAGAHTLTVQWRVLAANEQGDIGASRANLTVQSRPS